MARHKITKEYTGKAKAQHVVRFCNDFISSHDLKKDAIDAMRDHDTGFLPAITAH